MLLHGRVSGLREITRPIPDGPAEEAVVVEFDVSGADQDISVAGSKLMIILPRMLGKRWQLGLVTRLHLEDVTNGVEQPLRVV